MINSFPDVIDSFGGVRPFADAVGMNYGTAKQARRRKSINGRWFRAIAEAAHERGLQITERELAEIAANRASA